MGYLERNLEKRFDPALLVPGAESVLCFLAPYGQAGGGIAGFAQGVDYHKVVKDRLFAVIQELKKKFPAFEGRPFVDSAPVMERYWAVKAGLGFIGQNNFFISPEYGLRTIIGVIVCNIPADRFAPHAPLAATDCGACGACLRACPSGALRAPFELDAAKCLSYLTIESNAAAGASAAKNVCEPVLGTNPSPRCRSSKRIAAKSPRCPTPTGRTCLKKNSNGASPTRVCAGPVWNICRVNSYSKR